MHNYKTHLDYFCLARSTLKSCSFPIHRSGEMKNSHEPPAGRNFFFAISLSKKIYVKKIWKDKQLIYNKNVTLSIFIFNFYVHFLCWFIVIWEWWFISIKVLSCVPIQMKQTNISILSPIFGLTVFFIQTHFDSLCTAIEVHKKEPMTNLASLLWLNKNLTSVEERGDPLLLWKKKIKMLGLCLNMRSSYLRT